MRQRGKKSAAALAVVPLASKHKLPEPPSDLPESGAALWKRIVSELPPDRFRFADLPLLEGYVRAVLLTDQAQEQLDAEGLIVETRLGPRAHPMLAVLDSATKRAAMLGTKLRLHPSSRMRPESASLQKTNGPRPWEFGADPEGAKFFQDDDPGARFFRGSSLADKFGF